MSRVLLKGTGTAKLLPGTTVSWDYTASITAVLPICMLYLSALVFSCKLP